MTMDIPERANIDYDRIDEIALPALQRLLKPGELQSLSFEYSHKGELRAQMKIGEDRLSIRLSDPEVEETREEAAQRFYEDLQDFLATSELAWGELRE
ncbi:hypothetical protein [Brevibacterium sp.]|uniref:hypothetical protein n=1 Tax=Brevibacterium sp. TaxID=1701 RepID=UPI0028114854|nr:hypothetical protein [Brevibacterium sp.]